LNYSASVVVFVFLILQLGGTCLILASYNGHLDIVALVLGCGANVNMQDKVCVKLILLALYFQVKRMTWFVYMQAPAPL